MHDATTRSTADNPFQQEPEHTHMVIQEIAEANWGFSGLLTDDWKIDSPASRLLRIRTNHRNMGTRLSRIYTIGLHCPLIQ